MVLSHSSWPGNLDVKRWARSLETNGYMARMSCGALLAFQDRSLTDDVRQHFIVAHSGTGPKGTRRFGRP